LNTSYFAKYKGENAVSIAGKCPEWFKGREYKKLAPKYWFFNAYKKRMKEIEKEVLEDKNFMKDYFVDQAEDLYKQRYYKEVLSHLDAKQVYEELGENAILLCWEKSDQFCHRHLVAEWLENELGIELRIKITEL